MQFYAQLGAREQYGTLQAERWSRCAEACLVISYTSYLSRGSKQVISVPGTKGILVCLSYGGVGDDLVNRECILIYLNSPMMFGGSTADFVNPAFKSIHPTTTNSLVQYVYKPDFQLLQKILKAHSTH